MTVSSDLALIESRIADAVERLKLAYFVIDAGWYAQQGRNWYNSAGDWEVSDYLFPQGLDAAQAASGSGRCWPSTPSTRPTRRGMTTMTPMPADATRCSTWPAR